MLRKDYENCRRLSKLTRLSRKGASAGDPKGRDETMATMKLLTDAEVEAKPTVKAVFDDIRATASRTSLANDPALLKRTWEGLKAIMMVEGALDPLVREMIYIAVSTANGCAYCIHSHTAAARAGGMTARQQRGPFIAMIAITITPTPAAHHKEAARRADDLLDAAVYAASVAFRPRPVKK